MEEFYSYITVEKDRWDLISNKFYKTPYLYEKIIKANIVWINNFILVMLLLNINGKNISKFFI